MKEALKLALEAWKNAAIRLGEELSSVGPDGYYDMTAQQWLDWAMEQEPRGKNSLAQPEQGRLAKVEPCAVCGEGKARLSVLRSCDTCHSEYAGQAEMKVALGKPEQEPCGHLHANGDFCQDKAVVSDVWPITLYTTPPKRQPLTDEFCITEMIDVGQYSLQIIFKSRKNADEFKAALKEKNT